MFELMRWTRRSLALVALLVMTIGIAATWDLAARSESVPKNDSEVSTTIEQIRSRPKDFAGKRVKLTGQLSECYGWECSLCPVTMTNKDRDSEKCLALGFRPLIQGTGFGADEKESVFRFSEVVLSGTFDPSCWENGACLDRQTVLGDAEVISVLERRSGVVGLWLQNRTMLTEISDGDAIELKSAARRAGYAEGPPIKAFQAESSDRRIIVCWSPVGVNDEPGSWPGSLEGALYAKSTLDFFQCNEVKKVGGQFVVQA